MVSTFLKIVYDFNKRKYYVVRGDDPQEPLKEITLPAAIRLGEEINQFQMDAYNENMV